MSNKCEKLVVFDWGGVILCEPPDENNSKQAIVRIVKTYAPNISDEVAYQVYLETLHDEHGTNISTQNDLESKHKWVSRISRKLNRTIEYDDFVRTFSKEYQKISYKKEVVKYIASLEKTCKLGLMSNLVFACEDALKTQVKNIAFDYLWLSFKMGYRKPEKVIFEMIKQEVNMPAKWILLIDDKAKNIEQANKCGWHTCMATGNELAKIKDAVNHFLNANANLNSS